MGNTWGWMGAEYMRRCVLKYCAHPGGPRLQHGAQTRPCPQPRAWLEEALQRGVAGRRCAAHAAHQPGFVPGPDGERPLGGGALGGQVPPVGAEGQAHKLLLQRKGAWECMLRMQVCA